MEREQAGPLGENKEDDILTLMRTAPWVRATP